MRTTVFSLLLCLITLHSASGQPELHSNHEGTLSHLEGVAVGVTYYMPGSDTDVRALIKPQVQSKIRSAKGVTLYTESNEDAFRATEESRPFLSIDIDLRKSNQVQAGKYSIDFVVKQLATIKGSDEKEIRVDTYQVYGDIDGEVYPLDRADPLVEAQKAVSVMVDRFIRDFLKAHSD